MCGETPWDRLAAGPVGHQAPSHGARVRQREYRDLREAQKTLYSSGARETRRATSPLRLSHVICLALLGQPLQGPASGPNPWVRGDRPRVRTLGDRPRHPLVDEVASAGVRHDWQQRKRLQRCRKTAHGVPKQRPRGSLRRNYCASCQCVFTVDDLRRLHAGSVRRKISLARRDVCYFSHYARPRSCGPGRRRRGVGSERVGDKAERLLEFPKHATTQTEIRSFRAAPPGECIAIKYSPAGLPGAPPRCTHPTLASASCPTQRTTKLPTGAIGGGSTRGTLSESVAERDGALSCGVSVSTSWRWSAESSNV
eukprot:scaffold81752_cov63-Phaeocystis_antarctica.AAC.3